MSNDPEQETTARRSNDAAGSDDPADSGVSRRRLMAAGAAGWATVGLAGCSTIQPDCEDEEDGGDGGDGGDETTAPGDDTSDVTVTSQTTTTEGDTPTEDGGDGGGGDATTTACEQASVFAPGMDVGFLVSVYDDLTGDLLDDENLATVSITFPEADLDSIELTPSGPHEKHVRDKWGGKASFAEDAEPGTYRYEIEVETESDDEPKQVLTDELKLVEPRY